VSSENSQRGRGAEGGALLRGLKKAPKTSVVSELSGRPPIPAPVAEPEPVRQEKPEPIRQAVPEPAPQVDPGPKQDKPAKPKREKISYYQDSEDAYRIRAAHVNTIARTGYRSLSDFIASAVMKECARLEAAYNDGEPFVTGGDLVKRGRPQRHEDTDDR
jgi:Centromere-binding protein ParB C-terminal